MTSKSNLSPASAATRRVTVVVADRHSWGFELELECGHGHFHFTEGTKASAPDAVTCVECDAGGCTPSQ